MKLIYEIFNETYKSSRLEREKAITRCINKIEWCRQQIDEGKPIQGKLKSRLNQAIGKHREHRIWQFVNNVNPGVSRPTRSRKWGLKTYE